VALHGEVARLPEEQRRFKAAFVLLSAEPASDTKLADVARMAAIFGDRRGDTRLRSWADLTSGLSSVDTQLGERRREGEPIPDPAPGLTCDTLQQNCPREELACYGFSTRVCRLAGTQSRGESCTRSTDCRAGLDCLARSQDEAWRQPYCAPDECPTMCQHILIRDAGDNVVGAICSS
jgi:hypothetical protein